MQYSCPKCGYSGSNLIVEKSSSGVITNLVCRNCNRSTSVLIPKEIVKELVELCTTPDVTEVFRVVEPFKDVEEHIEIKEEMHNEDSLAPLDGGAAKEPLTLSITCPKCQSTDITIGSPISKRSRICNECGYDFKVNKKHFNTSK